MSILNSPITINNLEIKNRLVMPPMATRTTEDGSITTQLFDYYNDRAASNHIGLIITEYSYISPEGRAGRHQISMAENADIAGLKRLTTAIHQTDTKVIAQLNHAGSAARTQVTGTAVYAPSAVLATDSDDLPVEMTQDDIQKVIQDFTYAAIRAHQTGFDGIELHSAHGYLLNQFYSPLTNKRTDTYNGQTLTGRLKIHMEIIHSIRKVLGNDYLLALRLGACDYKEGGTTLQDSITAAQMLEEAGIDLLDISGGFCGPYHSNENTQGYFQKLSEGIKKSVHIPVILTGGITDGLTAERLLKEQKADMIGVGRPILKNPQWAEHAIISIQNL